jgi:hypothetical protein
MNEIFIDSFYFSFDKQDPNYGLKILIKFKSISKCLFFDSSNFIFKDEFEILNYDWTKIDYTYSEKDIYITSIKEDELVSYFVQLSNNDIFYIFQRVDNLQKWEQDFEFIKVKDYKYSKIEEYMNEDWIDEIKPDRSDM